MHSTVKYRSAREESERRAAEGVPTGRNRLLASLRWAASHWQLYALLAVPIAYLILFKYIPMYGVQIAFRRYNPKLGILGSPWVGLFYFKLFIGSYQFTRVLANTIGISVYQLIAGFPFPILLALSLNEVRRIRFRKFVQMLTYLPHFISTVVVVGMLYQMLSLYGLVNNAAAALGAERTSYLNISSLFKSLYVWSGIWQGTGYASIIYLAALSSVDTELYDAGRIDGMNIFQKITRIDLPAILPTVVILFILNASRVMNVGFEKVYLMQNALNMAASDVINTYVYRVGLTSANYSLGTAVGIFTSAVNMVILLAVNRVSRTLTETSLW